DTVPPESSKAGRVRDLCRKLKPLIGDHAQRIWQAYLAENDSGKIQVHEYLELLAARHFHEALDADRANLLPPTERVASGEYKLGMMMYNDHPLCEFGLRESEWIQHVGVFGRSGDGKTNAGLLLVHRLLEHNKPVLVLDWKRTYRALLTL